MSQTPEQPCARGCITPRRHVTDCPDREQCEGCSPRPAEFGQLCYRCHVRLENLVRAIPGQHDLLLAAATPSAEQRLSQETTARIGSGWRTDSAQRDQGPYARHVTLSAHEAEPIRLAQVDAAAELSDWLAQTVERLVEDYRARGPSRLLTQAERDAGGRVVWRAASAGHEAVTRLGHEREEWGVYVWAEPPPRFDVHEATRWLLAQLLRLEHDPDIGDVAEQFLDLMSRCHGLAPWREQVARLTGIPCVRCHRCTLARFGGDDFVTCLNRACGETYTPGQYAIWTRMLAEERQEGA